MPASDHAAPPVQMKAVVYEGPSRAALRTLPRPEGEGLLLEVEACGICGTDLTIWKGAHPRSRAPLILGHEFVARTLEAGKTLPKGTRVTCFPLISCGTCETCRGGNPHICETLRLWGIDAAGGMADYVRIPEADLVTLPDDLPAEVAAQAEPLAVCLHAARRAVVAGGEDIAIIGAGPIGVTLAFCLHRLGVRSVALFDTNAERVSTLAQAGLAADMATQAAFSTALQRIGRSGFDIVFECAGVAPAAAAALDLVRVGGRLVIVSIHKGAVPFDLQRVAFREVSVLGTRVYTRRDFDDACRLLPQMVTDLRWLAGPMFPPQAAPDLLCDLASGRGPLKAVIRFAAGQG